MRAQRAPLRPTFSPARLCHVVYAGFSGGQMETILAWDSTSHGGKMPEGYLHLTCEQRCQIYALLQSGHSQAHIARQIGVDPSTISRELVRKRARLSLQASAREGIAETRRGLGQAAQNDARFGRADRRKTDASAVESRSYQRAAGKGWHRLHQSH